VRSDFEGRGLVVLAFHAGVDKEAKVRRYLEKQEFRFTILLKTEQTAETAFGIKASGSAVLIGPNGRILWRGLQLDPTEIRRALDALRPPK
jgi:hypothetical protein